MQRKVEEMISIAAAAHKVGLNRSTLTRQVAKGAIRSHGGKVRLSEVIEDRAKNLSPCRVARSEKRRPSGIVKSANASKVTEVTQSALSACGVRTNNLEREAN